MESRPEDESSFWQVLSHGCQIIIVPKICCDIIAAVLTIIQGLCCMHQVCHHATTYFQHACSIPQHPPWSDIMISNRMEITFKTVNLH
jgi:hypothetical protein